MVGQKSPGKVASSMKKTNKRKHLLPEYAFNEDVSSRYKKILLLAEQPSNPTGLEVALHENKWLQLGESVIGEKGKLTLTSDGNLVYTTFQWGDSGVDVWQSGSGSKKGKFIKLLVEDVLKI